MPISYRGRVVSVRGQVSDYVIEPVRFTLGLSRVEMVDDHLAQLVRGGRGHGPDADALLDARRVFSGRA